MGKTLTIPNGMTYTEVTNNSDVGDFSNNQDGTFDVTNIDTTAVRNALGEDTNAIGSLSTSSKVNRWSYFKPDRNKLDAANEQIIYDVTSPYPIGEFAGYDDSANADYVSDYTTSDEYGEGVDGGVIQATYNVDQLDWFEELNPDFGDSTTMHLTMVVKDSNDNIVAEDNKQLAQQAGSKTYEFYISGIQEGSYTVEIWFTTYLSGTDKTTYYAKAPVDNWQWSCEITELSYPNAYLHLDSDDSTFDGVTLSSSSYASLSNDLAGGYDLSFVLEGLGMSIYDGKIYAKNGTYGTYYELYTGEYWKTGEPTESYSGQLPFSVGYGDTVHFLITTISH